MCSCIATCCRTGKDQREAVMQGQTVPPRGSGGGAGGAGAGAAGSFGATAAGGKLRAAWGSKSGKLAGGAGSGKRRRGGCGGAAGGESDEEQGRGGGGGGDNKGEAEGAEDDIEATYAGNRCARLSCVCV